jgi:hypothetical protein
MDITTGQRTFYLAVSSASQAQTVDIIFEDTQGNNIKCNYVKIEAAAIGTSQMGSFAAELSGLSRTGNMILNQLSSVTNTITPNASGILGIGGIYGTNIKSEAVWHGCNGEICTGIRLQHRSQSAGSFNSYFGITYGNLIPYNVLRTDAYNKGV